MKQSDWCLIACVHHGYVGLAKGHWPDEHTFTLPDGRIVALRRLTESRGPDGFHYTNTHLPMEERGVTIDVLVTAD